MWYQTSKITGGIEDKTRHSILASAGQISTLVGAESEIQTLSLLIADKAHAGMVKGNLQLVSINAGLHTFVLGCLKSLLSATENLLIEKDVHLISKSINCLAQPGVNYWLRMESAVQ